MGGWCNAWGGLLHHAGDCLAQSGSFFILLSIFYFTLEDMPKRGFDNHINSCDSGL
jgi:hypothetical protein